MPLSHKPVVKGTDMQTEFVTMNLENNPAWNAELEGFKPIITDYGKKRVSLLWVCARKVRAYRQDACDLARIPEGLIEKAG